MRRIFQFGRYDEHQEPWQEGIGFFRSLAEMVIGGIIVLFCLIVWYAWKTHPSD